ncbi:hypothetical protein EZS27_031163 [termite gut metagenome]|uniref:Uncharacterized protein n=1 Tax=termite gut metagenome TaxID=433724 RepID=A0A5J4QDM4_9ZZZZ
MNIVYQPIAKIDIYTLRGMVCALKLSKSWKFSPYVCIEIAKVSNKQHQQRVFLSFLYNQRSISCINTRIECSLSIPKRRVSFPIL